MFDPNAASAPGSGIYGLPHTPEQAGVVLIPVPWDVTTSYRPGTANGPRAILEASRQVDVFDAETGRPYEAGIAMLEESAEVAAWNKEGRRLAEPIIAAGGASEAGSAGAGALTRVDELGVRLNEWVRAQARRWRTAGRLVGIVGGDHAVPFGAIEDAAEAHPGLGILHFDAHADLREAFEGFTWSHASIMHNVVTRLPGVGKLVQVGLRDLCEAEMDLIRGSRGRIIPHFDAEIASRLYSGESWAGQCQRIVHALPSEVWVSFDIDGLDPTLCPHTGTPVPGGLQFAQAVMLVGEVARSGRRIVGFDLVEVAPDPDGDEWDGNVGARLLYKLVGWALLSNGEFAE
jgi:agmatinase